VTVPDKVGGAGGQFGASNVHVVNVHEAPFIAQKVDKKIGSPVEWVSEPTPCTATHEQFSTMNVSVSELLSITNLTPLNVPRTTLVIADLEKKKPHGDQRTQGSPVVPFTPGLTEPKVALMPTISV
jgi:hypothetical protein